MVNTPYVMFAQRIRLRSITCLSVSHPSVRAFSLVLHASTHNSLPCTYNLHPALQTSPLLLTSQMSLPVLFAGVGMVPVPRVGPGSRNICLYVDAVCPCPPSSMSDMTPTHPERGCCTSWLLLHIVILQMAPGVVSRIGSNV
jgi:hypothetical protein